MPEKVAVDAAHKAIEGSVDTMTFSIKSCPAAAAALPPEVAGAWELSASRTVSEVHKHFLRQRNPTCANSCDCDEEQPGIQIVHCDRGQN